jgi:hypothetical protein
MCHLPFAMKSLVLVTVAVASLCVPAIAQEESKPVPKDSVRVSIPGCAKGVVFTAAPRTVDQPARADIPEGMRIRMNGPKKLLAEIKARQGSMIEITGLMRRGQFKPAGIGVGGVRIEPGIASAGGTTMGSPVANQISIDVESWRPAVGDCR